MNKERKYDFGEIEINVVGFAQFILEVIWGRKKILLFFFLVSFFAAITIFVITPRLSKTYLISEIISVPSLGLTQDLTQLESFNRELEVASQEIIQKINSGYYNHQLRSSLESPENEQFSFVVNYKKDQKFISISLLAPEKRLPTGEKALVSLYAIIKNEFEPAVQARREIIKNTIREKELKMQNLMSAKHKISKSVIGDINDVELLAGFDLNNIIKNINYSEQIIKQRINYLLDEFVFLRNLQSELFLLRINYVGHANRKKILYNKIKKIKLELDAFHTGDLAAIDNEIKMVDLNLKNLKIEHNLVNNAMLIQPPFSMLHLMTRANVAKMIFCFVLIGSCMGIIFTAMLDYKKMPSLFRFTKL